MVIAMGASLPLWSSRWGLPSLVVIAMHISHDVAPPPTLGVGAGKGGGGGGGVGGWSRGWMGGGVGRGSCGG